MENSPTRRHDKRAKTLNQQINTQYNGGRQSCDNNGIRDLKELNSILSTITKFSGRGNTKLNGTGRFLGGNTL